MELELDSNNSLTVLFTLNFLLQAKVSSSLAVGATSESHSGVWLMRCMALRVTAGLPCTLSSSRADLVITKGFSWHGMASEGAIPSLSCRQ